MVPRSKVALRTKYKWMVFNIGPASAHRKHARKAGSQS